MYMKNIGTTLSVAIFFIIIALAASCKKKDIGVCYCSYLSGDKKEYDMRDLTRNQAQDSCNVLNGYASAFAGSCKLK
jgi:hypothetical protein